MTASKSTPGTGDSWATAYTSLADAQKTASPCSAVTEIWVAEGTYTKGSSKK